MGVSAADFYTGIVTDVYAALRSTTFDAGRYLEFVRDAGQPALELGCGDDGPFLELLRRGIDIDGVDSSQDMLDRCQAQADIEGLRIATYCQPMQDLALPSTTVAPMVGVRGFGSGIGGPVVGGGVARWIG